MVMLMVLAIYSCHKKDEEMRKNGNKKRDMC